MTNPRLATLDNLFQQIVALPSGAREAELERRCGRDRELRRAVESLLAHDRAAGDCFLAGQDVAARGDLSVNVPGTTIGPYKLIERIGSGGCGVVYAAERIAPAGPKVALKIIRLGTETPEVVARFQTERRALSLMDHPNIARMHHAGATGCGRPYFVMEYVQGTPITHYCDAETLDVDRRLGLFIPVCDAVEHAHRRGFVHRDVKPSNILVTIIDGHPVCKVIDFGIAKAVRGHEAERVLVTEHGELLGTPEYMSPEQADPTGPALDSTTDIYSLGAALYEFVAGVLPIGSDRFEGKHLDDIRRTLRHTDVPKPSTRLRQLEVDARRAKSGPSLNDIARHRRTDVRTLRRRLAGDLDRIIMKAMEKDRVRRYASAAELSADLREHLDSEAKSTTSRRT